ncbi:DinB family protein [Flindersiella endophytica]
MVDGKLSGMKEILWSALRSNREALLWKLEGLSEYDRRRPLTPTGTNLLGVLKHVGSEEYGYLGETFGRPAPEQLACMTDGSIWQGGDMWATPEESTEYLLGYFRRACAWADETIASLPLDAEGSVPWWSDGKCTLGQILVLMVSETARHTGHVDIVRELIDGAAGDAPGSTSMGDRDKQSWQDYVAQVESAARKAAIAAGEELPSRS